jgi:phosphohistidine phosphatase
VLFLVHHAEAVDALIDPQRPLTAAGRTHAERTAAAVAARGAKPAAIWHSGKLRARQTAECFWRACNPLAEFTAARGLQPEDPPQWIADVLTGDEREILLVGHMPHLGRLLVLLQRESGGAAGFPAHGCIALEQGQGGWREVWRE